MGVDSSTGTTLSAAHFVPGQYVDVIGNSCVSLCPWRLITHTCSVLERDMREP